MLLSPLAHTPSCMGRGAQWHQTTNSLIHAQWHQLPPLTHGYIPWFPLPPTVGLQVMSVQRFLESSGASQLMLSFTLTAWSNWPISRSNWFWMDSWWPEVRPKIHQERLNFLGMHLMDKTDIGRNYLSKLETDIGRNYLSELAPITFQPILGFYSLNLNPTTWVVIHRRVPGYQPCTIQNRHAKQKRRVAH